MIVYYLVAIFLGFAGIFLAPLTLLPDASLPTYLTAAISSLGSDIYFAWHLMPLTIVALLLAIGVVIAVESHIFSYKIIKWIYSKIPGVN